MQIAVTGIFWYRSAEDYDRFLAIFQDAAKLPATYAEWLVKAEALERSLQVANRQFVRAYAEPEDFVAWCYWFAAKSVLGAELT